MRTSTALQRHDFDPIAFVFGVLFTGSGILFMIGRFDVFNHARWLWPGLLVLLGIAVLVGARGRGSHAGGRAPGAGSTAAAPLPPVDLDAIEPPVGPEAFRLPGWPPRTAETSKAPKASKAGCGSDTDVLEPVEASGTEATGQEPSRPDPHGETEVIAKVDPKAETQVLGGQPPEEPPERG